MNERTKSALLSGLVVFGGIFGGVIIIIGAIALFSYLSWWAGGLVVLAVVAFIVAAVVSYLKLAPGDRT